jgi:hypothetical protein
LIGATPRELENLAPHVVNREVLPGGKDLI